MELSKGVTGELGAGIDQRTKHLLSSFHYADGRLDLQAATLQFDQMLGKIRLFGARRTSGDVAGSLPDTLLSRLDAAQPGEQHARGDFHGRLLHKQRKDAGY